MFVRKKTVNDYLLFTTQINQDNSKGIYIKTLDVNGLCMYLYRKSSK